MKHRVLVLGAGKIGRTIAPWLASAGDYEVTVADVAEGAIGRVRVAAERAGCSLQAQAADVTDSAALARLLRGCDSVVSALSFKENPRVAEAALKAGASYFDLTEDVATTRAVRAIAERAGDGQVFAPQCGLAPGFVSIVAHDLTQGFERLDRVFMRVGALPQFPSNALKYNLTWSTDGLVNEYCNPCEAIVDGRLREVLPLEGLEHFSIDGVRYEAFNTSGGLGTLCETLEGQVRELNYKTIRYLGHRDYAAFLVNELRLSSERELLRRILERAVPITYQDVVVVFCTVSGYREGQLVQVTDSRKIYNADILGQNWSAIQRTTAAGLCAVLDLHRADQLGSHSGLIKQESVSLTAFLDNRFGRHYSRRPAEPALAFTGALS